MLGMISTGLDKWYREHGVEGADKIMLLMPINNRPPPKSMAELDLDNNMTAIKFEQPIKPDIQAAMAENRRTLSHLLNPTYLACSKTMGKLLPYLSENACRGVFADFCKGVDFMFSNVPFSTEPWHFCNKEIRRFGVFVNVQGETCVNFVAVTYKGNLRLTVMAKNQLKMDPARLLDIVVQQIEDDIAAVKQE